MDSILTSIKKLLGISESYTHFDQDIIIYINGAFFTLYQLGVGPNNPFVISDASAIWADFESDKSIELVKTYIYYKVKQSFDPPANSTHFGALQDQIRECEWRLNIEYDPNHEE